MHQQLIAGYKKILLGSVHHTNQKSNSSKTTPKLIKMAVTVIRNVLTSQYLTNNGSSVAVHHLKKHSSKLLLRFYVWVHYTAS